MLTNHGRSNTSQVVLIITDGVPSSQQQATTQANAIKKDGISILGVGVGPSLKPAEIKALCSSPSDYFPVAAWSDLDKMLEKIINASCAPAAQLWECVDDTSCLPSNASSAVSKATCEKLCGKPPAPPPPPPPPPKPPTPPPPPPKPTTLYECVEDAGCMPTKSGGVTKDVCMKDPKCAPPSPPPTPKCEGKIDLVLLLDSSCSIDAPSWKQEAAFVSKLTGALDINATGVHVGIIEFAQNVTDNLSPSGDSNAVKNAIAHLSPASSMGCETMTGVGLQHAHHMLTAHGRPKPASQVVLMITDGVPQPSSQQQVATTAANAIKKGGITIVGVGVGSVKPAEIKALCSSPSDYFPVASWSDIDAVLNKIISATCPKPPPAPSVSVAFS